MQMAHSLVSPRKSDAIVVVSSTMRSLSNNSNRPNHNTLWASSLSKQRDDLLSHLRESRAKDVKMKTQLAEMIRCSLEECLAENEILTDAITQLVEESKLMEDQYRILETEVIQLRNSNGTNAQKEHIQLVDSAAMKQENSNHHQRANHEWQKERKALIEQIEQQQQEIKLLKSKIKRTKKVPNAAASISQHSSQDVVSLDPDEYLKRFKEKCNRGRSQSVEESVTTNIPVELKNDSASTNNENAHPKPKRRGSVAGSRGRIKTEMPAERMQRTWHGGSRARDQMNDILNSKHDDSVPKVMVPIVVNENEEKSNLEMFLEGLSPGVDPDSSGDLDVPKHVSKNETVKKKGTTQDNVGVRNSSSSHIGHKNKGRNLQNTWHGGSVTDRGSIHRMLVGNPPLDERRHRKGRDERRGSANDIEASIPEEPEFNDDNVEGNGQPPRTQVVKRRSSASAVQFEKIFKGCSTWHGGVEDRKKTMQMLLGSRKPSQEFEDESSVLSESVEDAKLKSLIETAKLNQSFSSPDEPGGIDGFQSMPDATLDKSTHSNFATGCDLPSRKASYSSILLENEDALFSECPSPASKDKDDQTISSSLINNEHRPGRRGSVSSRSNILKKYKLLPKLGKQKKLTAELA